MSFAFIENHWYLFALLLFSGAMLIWPTVKRRLSPARDIGNLEATRLINSANALLVDLRETKEFEGGRLPSEDDHSRACAPDGRTGLHEGG